MSRVDPRTLRDACLPPFLLGAIVALLSVLFLKWI